MDKKLILYGITAIFAILALAYQLNKNTNDSEENQKSVERYIEIEKLMNQIIDTCTKPDSPISKEKCKLFTRH